MNNLNRKLTATDLLAIAMLLPVLIYFSDNIRLMLLTVAFVWVPLTAAVYLLRWYLARG